MIDLEPGDDVIMFGVVTETSLIDFGRKCQLTFHDERQREAWPANAKVDVR